jgi:hypothetical protein
MTTKHKKGPWRIGAVESGRVAIDSADGQEVTGFIDPEDAPLILSAPDLLEALQWYEAKAVQMGRAAIDQDSKLLLELMKEIAVEYGARARASIANATREQP